MILTMLLIVLRVQLTPDSSPTISDSDGK